jgi:hypothetical protein
MSKEEKVCIYCGVSESMADKPCSEPRYEHVWVSKEKFRETVKKDWEEYAKEKKWK